MRAGESRKRVAVLQSTIPHYRVPLFEAVADQAPFDLHVYAAPQAPGHPPSKAPESDRYRLTLRMRPFLKNKVFWQRGAFGVLKDLRETDVLVVSGDARILSNLPLMLRARSRGIRTVWWGQGFFPGSAHRVGLRQRLMRFADAVLLYTDREVERYRAMGFDHPRMFGLNNALDQRPIQEAKERWPESRLAQFRAETGLDPSRTFLTVGRLTEKMRLDLAIRALADPSLADAQLVVIGEGPAQKSAERLAIDLGVAARLRWVGALYDEEKLAPYFLSSSVFVYPGAIGLSIFHAFGYGLPVVTHGDETHQMPEFAALQQGWNGVTFQREDLNDLIRALIATVTDQTNGADLFHNSRQTRYTEWTLTKAASLFFAAVNW